MDEVGDRLEANVPAESTHAIVHGDYKLDKVAVSPGADLELVGVFGWEMSTLGDPLADVAWLLLYWREASDPPAQAGDLPAPFLEREGYPTRR